MQRVFNVDKWTMLEEGVSLAFSNDRARNVRLDVNAPQKTEVWYACTATGEAFFLALVEGRDVIEFGSIGPFEITTKGGPLAVFTNDGDDISMKPTAEAAFVKVMERRRRNPELEYIAWKMEQNMNARMEAQAHELQQLFERREAARAAELAAQGVSGGAGGTSGQTDGSGASGSSDSATTGGDQKNEAGTGTQTAAE